MFAVSINLVVFVNKFPEGLRKLNLPQTPEECIRAGNSRPSVR
jgi:hypothetical protein